MQGQLRKDKISELLASRKKLQYAFTRSRDVSDGAVKASYLIARKLVQTSRPFSDGELVKICMMKAVEVVCPEYLFAFFNISLSRYTIADRADDLSRNMGSQIQDKIKSFIAFSAAIDERADVTDTTQQYVLNRGVDESLTVTEEFLELVLMMDSTTVCDIFRSLVTALDKAGVDWSRAVSLAVDGAPSVVGRNAGVITKCRENV